jgi:phosphohistidine phosphatase
MANIIVWRHAQAEETSETGLDHDRALTSKGKADAHKMAKWLDKHLPDNTQIYVSPALRCQQTAEALIMLNSKKIRRQIELVDVLGIQSSALAIKQSLILRSDEKNLLLVGHQPILGELINDILSTSLHEELVLAEPNNQGVVVKKGAVWWLKQKSKEQLTDFTPRFFLVTVQHPSLLK